MKKIVLTHELDENVMRLLKDDMYRTPTIYI